MWGDHGWKLGEHNGWCKQTNYEIDTHSPLIFAGKGVAAKGENSNALTEFIDIYPTLCEMVGLEVPENLQGSSLVPLLYDPQKEWTNAADSQFLMGKSGPLKNRGHQRMGYAVRTDRYRYIEWYEWNHEKSERGNFITSELYDHINDFEENINISSRSEYAELILALSTKLKMSGRENKE